MTEKWFGFDQRELILILSALQFANKKSRAAKTEKLISKILDGGRGPDITIGVYGGQVQWVSGNPFPIRVCDYDGEKVDLPGVDEEGNRCRVWFESTDKRFT